MSLSEYQLIHVLILVIGSGIGAYLSSYLKHKGEDQATREQFKTILSQVSKTTEATEAIKATLSSRVWLLQQQWNIREQRYAELLSHLTKFRWALLDQADYFQVPHDTNNESLMVDDRFKGLQQRANESRLALRDLVGPSSIFLSDSTIAALNKMEVDHYPIANYDAMCLSEYVDETLRVVNTAYSAVLEEARAELRLTESQLQ